jgi:hypothetical protein
MEHILEQNKIIVSTMEKLNHRPINEFEMNSFQELISSSRDKIERHLLGVANQITALDKNLNDFVDYMKANTG